MSSRQNRIGNFEIPQDPELADIIKVALRELQLEMRTSVPATVVSFDPATNAVNVTLGIRPVTKNLQRPPTAADPAPVTVQPPQIYKNIPVAWPSTKAGYVTFPIVPGDEGEINVFDRDIQGWLNDGRPQEPALALTHALASSTFRPGGIRSKVNPVATGPIDMTATVIEGTSTVKIGSGAINSATRAELLISAIDTALDAAITAAAPIASPAADGGTAGFAALKSTWSSAKETIKALKVKVE